MVTDLKKLPNSRVKLTITVNADEFAHAFEHELADVTKDLKVEGFRPGKAPKAQVIAKVGRQRIEAGALDHAISHAYYDALQEKDLVPVAGPDVAVTDFTAPAEDAAGTEKVATFTAEVDVVPAIELKNYQKMKIKAPKVEPVKEEDITEVIDYLRDQRATLKEAAKDAVVAKGMWADIAFDGSVGGVAREDMKSANHPLVVGRGQLIPGFEENMLGMKAGEEKTFTVTFPKDYHAAELAGKKAVFTVKINELKEVVLPDLDDDFAVPLGQKNVAGLKDAVRKNIEEERETEHKRKLEDLVVEELLKLAKFELPQALVTQEEERLTQDAQAQMGRMGLTWEQYLENIKKTDKEVREEIAEQARKNVRIGLALGKIVQEENITDRDNAMHMAVEKLIEYATR